MLSLNPITYELTHRCEQELRMQEIERKRAWSARNMERRTARSGGFSIQTVAEQLGEWLAGLRGMTPGYRG